MASFFEESVFFGVLLSLAAYGIGTVLKKKTGLAIANPLLISIVIVIAVLLLFDIDYETYNAGAKYISYLLTPATVCLAIPLYRQFELLKKNWGAILLGIGAGVAASLGSVSVLAWLFHFSREEWITLLPKSLPTAIGMGVSEELGGYVSITVAAIILTGVFGNICAETVCRIFRITDPVAKGIGIGSASHAIGTSRAMEMGEVEGAMSSLSIVVAGILTVVFASLVVQIV
ncbi:MAG: LrgB family protein [Lachnospiraceae bacterium]|nr:LrgB family protein [Lachnospiraceae bacterium]